MDNNGIYNVHYCNVQASRAAREHERLVKAYQTWLNLREKTRRSLIAQIDRTRSADAGRGKATRTLLGLQSELDKMDREDKEPADADYLAQYPHSITCHSAAYQKLAFELALQKSEAECKKTEEVRQLALAQQDVQDALGSQPINTNLDENADIINEEAPEPDPASPSTPRGGESAFKRLDALLGRLNSTPTRYVGKQLKQPLPEKARTGSWASRWGLHDVAANHYVAKPRSPKQK